MSETIGVLAMSYGTPESLDQIEPYYTHIRRGHKPSDEQLAALTARYEAIVGGVFPLRENTNRQVADLEAALNRDHADYRFKCYQGMKHAQPFVEDGVKAMAADGIRRAIGIVLAPHYSVMSVGSYIKRAQAAAAEAGVQLDCVESYQTNPKLVRALTERVDASLATFGAEVRDDVLVMFTAHSLPERILQMNDPYVDQLLETSRAVAEAAGVKRWQFGWQSAGATNEVWLGPDLLDTMRTLAEEGEKRLLVCPCGFVSDHLEVLYDLDIEAAGLASELGMEFARTASLNTDPLYMEALSDEVYVKLTRTE